MKKLFVTNAQFRIKLVMTLCYMALMVSMGVYSQFVKASATAHNQQASAVEWNNSSAK